MSESDTERRIRWDVAADHDHRTGQDLGHSHDSDSHDHVHVYDDGYHDHHGDDLTPEEQDELAERLWALENVELRTVGVDIGSSTSHLMFAQVHLHRLGDALSSRFVVVNREVLWRSPIELTPYRSDDTIDTDALERFIEESYAAAGLRRDEIDSGAVILTGEALKRKNAEAIAHLFAAESGKFVCALAGHHMEAALAAHGCGAVALSRSRKATILNVDIGGGTSKLALVRNGEVLATAAVAIGGRLIALDAERRVTRLEDPARVAAEALGIDVDLGKVFSETDQARLIDLWTEILVGLINGGPVDQVAQRLAVTDALPPHDPVDAITFSGGVAEYIFWRELESYEDLGNALGTQLRAALSDGRVTLPVHNTGEGIRATVIGASQFTVQLSGSTISVSNGGILPLRNLPVIYPRLDLSEDVPAATVSAEIGSALRRMDIADGDTPVALGLRWPGDPLYRRMRLLAEGIAQAMPRSVEKRLPLVLLFDRDVGRTLGDILRRDLGVACDVVSIDGMDLKEFDYVDIGEIVEPTNVVPVVIKSLLFAGRNGAASG